MYADIILCKHKPSKYSVYSSTYTCTCTVLLDNYRYRYTHVHVSYTCAVPLQKLCHLPSMIGPSSKLEYRQKCQPSPQSSADSLSV